MYRPEWVAELARKYFTRTISQFILHGNIVDFVRAEDAAGATQYYRFKDYLLHELFKRRNIVVSFDRAAGISFRDPEVKRDFMTIFLPNYDLIHGTSFARGPLSDPQVAFALLESYFMNRLRDGKKIAFIIDYAETLAPMGASSYASVQDRAILVFLQRWAKESLFLNSDMTTVLLAENLNDLNQQLVRNPYTCEIDVPYPEVNERLDFVRYFFRQNPRVAEKLEMDEAVFADNTSGLNLVQLKTMLAEIDAGEQTFTHEELSRRKKAIIELEAGGLLEFIESKYNLDSVAGHAAAKSHLRAAAGALRKGKGDVLPMGYLVNGPVGTGKTFLVSCFASDIGIPMLQLKNFRSQWQGVTEANLEKVLKIISAMAPVAVRGDLSRSTGGGGPSLDDCFFMPPPLPWFYSPSLFPPPIFPPFFLLSLSPLSLLLLILFSTFRSSPSCYPSFPLGVFLPAWPHRQDLLVVLCVRHRHPDARSKTPRPMAG